MNPAISTSLIHDMVSSGVLARTSGSVLTLHHVVCVREFSQTSRFLPSRESRFVEVCGSRLNPSPCLMAIPDTPSTHRVPGFLRQSRTAAKHTSGTQKSQGLAENVGCFRAVRCLLIVRKSFLIQSIHMDLQSAESVSKYDSQQKNLLAFEQKFICKTPSVSSWQNSP